MKWPTTPEWADPRTLRWVADQLDGERAYRAGVAEEFEAKAAEDRKRKVSSLESRRTVNRLAGMSDILFQIAGQLRARAGRIEGKRRRQSR